MPGGLPISRKRRNRGEHARTRFSTNLAAFVLSMVPPNARGPTSFHGGGGALPSCCLPKSLPQSRVYTLSAATSKCGFISGGNTKGSRGLKKKHRRTCRAVQRSLAMVARTGFAPAVSSLREERGTRDRRRETPLPNSRGESGRAVSRTTSASFVTWGGVQQWCWGWCDDRYSK